MAEVSVDTAINQNKTPQNVAFNRDIHCFNYVFSWTLFSIGDYIN